MKNLVPDALVSVHNVKCLIQCCAKRDWTDKQTTKTRKGDLVLSNGKKE